MADLPTTVNSAGLILTLVGVLVAYLNSPLNEWRIDGGDASTDFKAIERDTERRNQRLKLGIGAMLVGTLLQLVSNYRP